MSSYNRVVGQATSNQPTSYQPRLSNSTYFASSAFQQQRSAFLTGNVRPRNEMETSAPTAALSKYPVSEEILGRFGKRGPAYMLQNKTLLPPCAHELAQDANGSIFCVNCGECFDNLYTCKGKLDKSRRLAQYYVAQMVKESGNSPDPALVELMKVLTEKPVEEEKSPHADIPEENDDKSF
jgi:hypothetical protein